MDKFLNFCFKIGKIVLFLLLGLCLVVMLIAISYLPETFNKISVETPDFLELKSESRVLPLPQNDVKQYNHEPYKDEFYKIKDIFTEYGQKMFLSHIEMIEEEYKEEYVKGAGIALKNSINECQVANLSERGCSMLFEETLNNYTRLFKRNITRKNLIEIAQKTQRIIAFIVLGVSLLTFILFLAIALLIKIEENTRK